MIKIPNLGRAPALLKRFIRADNGNFAIMFALSIIPFTGVVGIALDYSLASTSRIKLQTATDIAAIAVAKSLAKNPNLNDGQLQSIAAKTFQINISGAYLTSNIIPVFKRLEGGVRVDASAKVKTNLSRIIGFKSIDISTFSEAAANFTKIELALVLDNTGSMGSGGRMRALKEASNDLIDVLIPADATKDMVKIAVVPYDVTVNVGAKYLNASWLVGANVSGKKKKTRRSTYPWCGLVKPANTDYIPQVSPWRIYAYNMPCAPLPTIQTLTGTVGVLKAKISRMTPNGWTYIPAGLMWGWRTIDPGKPFTQAKPYDDPEWQKVIVLMTDGANTSKWSNGRLSTGISSGPGDAKTKKICRDIKKRNIRIFTVAFGLSSSRIKKLLRNCASSEGDFFATFNSAELKAAFSSIAGSINKMRLTK